MCPCTNSIQTRQSLLKGVSCYRFKVQRVNNILSIFVRDYSSNNDTPVPNLSKNPWFDTGVEKFYKDPDTMKTVILKENKEKSGIYRWTNKLSGDFYIGSSINLSGRFLN